MMDNLAARLAAREKELSAIYENVPGILFYIAVEPDGEFRFLSVSRDFLTATGLSREQVVGSLVRDIIPPPSREVVLDHYREAVRSGQPVRWGEKSLYPAGQRYGEVAVTPLYDPSGVATHLVGIVHDITERKQLEERLAENLIEAAPDAMVVVDQSGRIVLVNAQTERLFGYQREELLQHHFETLIPARFHERYQAHRRTLFSQPRVRPMGAGLELFAVRKDGIEVPVEISLSPIETPDGTLVTSAIRDITERKLAEESRHKLATIVESSEDAIVSGTLDGIITSWNSGAQHIYGYTEAEAVGKHITILTPPDLPGEENHVLQTLKAGHRIEHFETIRITKAGKRINVSLTISPIKDSSGRTVGISGIARDITERKLAEQRLREYEKAVECAEDMIGVIDQDYRFVLANRRYLKLRNLTREQVVGRLIPEVLTREEFETVVKPRLDECFRGKVVSYEARFSYPEIGERDLLLSYYPIEGARGRIDRAACILHDITDRKRAEEAMREMNCALEGKNALLQAREELLRVFVKNVPVAVAMLDRDMRYLQVSDRWCSDNSVKASEILGRSLYDDGPEMPECWREANRRALEGETLRSEEDPWECEGRTRWCRWEVRPWKNADGSVGGILVFAEDVTKRKQMEEELSGMSRKLIDSQEQERARIGRELHDDINQRLAMVSVEVQRLQGTPSELPHRTEQIRKELHQISDDVQALSHDLHSSKMEYLGAVAGMKSWCKEFAGRHNFDVDFKADVPGTLPTELGVSLFRILQEALQNIVKHSGVKRVDIDLRMSSGEIRLDIRDAGKGFDVDAALQGKGLGLISMRERVRLVRGAIAIDSNPREGTRISIRVPIDSYVSSRKEAV